MYCIEVEVNILSHGTQKKLSTYANSERSDECVRAVMGLAFST